MNRLSTGCLVAAVVAFGFATIGCENQTNSATPVSGPPQEVGVMTVEPESVILTTELSGRTAPHLVAEVRPQVGGIIKERLFVEGSDVKAGDLLYQIDPATYRAAYASAKASLSKAEANLVPARFREERFRDLVEINAVSRQNYDDVSASLKLAEADVEGARAALETARINLEYTSVKAPISGRIGRSSVTTGALVTASQPQPLATIQQLDPVYVDVTQSSADLLRLKRNLASGVLKNDSVEQATVSLLLEDGTNYPLLGSIKFSEVSVDQGTGSVTLRTIFPNPHQLLLPGMFVRAVIEEGVNEEALLVPQRGVTRNPAGEAMVMVVDAEGKVAARMIKVTRTIGDSWLVSEGLDAGDRVILEGTQKVRPGMPVTAVPFTGTAAVTQPPEGRD